MSFRVSVAVCGGREALESAPEAGKGPNMDDKMRRRSGGRQIDPTRRITIAEPYTPRQLRLHAHRAVRGSPAAAVGLLCAGHDAGVRALPEGTDEDLASQHEARVPKPRDVSEGFAQVLERMIEPAPEDRFASADELLDALDGASDVVVYQPQQVVAAAGSPVAVRVLFVGISAMLLVILAFLFLLAPA